MARWAALEFSTSSLLSVLTSSCLLCPISGIVNVKFGECVEEFVFVAPVFWKGQHQIC